MAAGTFELIEHSGDVKLRACAEATRPVGGTHDVDRPRRIRQDTADDAHLVTRDWRGDRSRSASRLARARSGAAWRAGPPAGRARGASRLAAAAPGARHLLRSFPALGTAARPAVA